ncbi:hypothetical protein PLICRDRAFT_558614 [Plicaturopsis crispa FD-325 SS-3]|nr:hypothetical protein PLICRDRAFT_558614 [Plicaturopsis crispa FD-325 SS-3]
METAKLPWELVDGITANIRRPKDLLALALTSQAFKQLVIPAHLEYRELSFDEAIFPGAPALWAQLASRRDLARNVRALSFDYPTPKGGRVPSAFRTDQECTAEEGSSTDPRVIIQALSNMEGLESFSWNMSRCAFVRNSPTASFIVEDIWAALVRCKHLHALKLSSEFGPYQISPDSSLWRLSALRSVSLEFSSARFWNSTIDKGLTAMLQHSRALEVCERFAFSQRLLSTTDVPQELAVTTVSLSIPAAVPSSISLFSQCHFPRLRKVSLFVDWPDDGVTLPRFLEAHPTIEDLSWLTMVKPLSPGSLPLLRRLHGSRRAALEILSDRTNPPRQIESLENMVLDKNFLEVLENVDKTSMRALQIVYCENSEYMRRVADMLPSLRSLRIKPTSDPGCQLNLRKALPSLPKLEELRGLCVNSDTLCDNATAQLVFALTESCPRLRVLDYYDFYNRVRRELRISRHEGSLRWEAECRNFDSDW